MSGIFLGYRRDDAAPWAGRLFERLLQDFPRSQLFMDVDAIEPGLDFIRALNEHVSLCKVLLAIIGPNWILAQGSNGHRRLDDPRDLVRLEIASALDRGIRVIPVLVDGARMPQVDELPDALKALSRRNAFHLSHIRFGSDATALIEVLKKEVVHLPNSEPMARLRSASAEKSQQPTDDARYYVESLKNGEANLRVSWATSIPLALLCALAAGGIGALSLLLIFFISEVVSALASYQSISFYKLRQQVYGPVLNFSGPLWLLLATEGAICGAFTGLIGFSFSTHSWRWIGASLVCFSLLYALDGDLKSLASVYWVAVNTFSIVCLLFWCGRLFNRAGSNFPGA